MRPQVVTLSWSRWLILVAAFSASLLGAVPGGGETELIKKDLRQLAQEAELVVVANVVSNHAAWDAKRRLIWTTTLLEVEASWKGQAPRHLKVKELGGIVGDIGMKVAGAPRYAPGERAVLFLKKDALGQWRTHGWTQGRFTVMPSKTGPRMQVAHRHVVTGFFPASQTMGSAPLPFAAFETRVRGLVVAPVLRSVPTEKGDK